MNQAIGKSQGLYLEDLHVGQRFVSGTHNMDEARGLAASGWHTAAVAMRLLVDGGLPLGNGIIGLGGELAWPQPTRPGDTLPVESEILEIVPSRSKPNQAIVKVRSTTLNQNAEPVHSFTSKCLVFKRPQIPA